MSFFYADLQPMARPAAPRSLLPAPPTLYQAPAKPMPAVQFFPTYQPAPTNVPLLPARPLTLPQPQSSQPLVWDLEPNVYTNVMTSDLDMDMLLHDPSLLCFDADLESSLGSGPTSPASNFELPSPQQFETSMFSSLLLPQAPAPSSALLPPMMVKTEPVDSFEPLPAADAVATTTTRAGRKVRQVSFNELADPNVIDLEPAPPRRRLSGTAGAPTSRRRSSSFMAVKRDSHNVSERFRRAELKTSLDELRALVPSVKDDSRVHTSTILQETIAYIRSLEQEDLELQRQIQEQRALMQLHA